MIKKFCLRNGLKVICDHMDSIRTTAIGVWIGAGARDEDAARSGVSHFLEHVLFKGTQRRTARQIAEEIDFIGGQINAFTAKDCTCFYTKTLDTHAGIAIDILSDMLFFSKLDKSDMDLERNVILEEINMYEDTPDELANEMLAEGVWKDCALGNPVLGSPESLARIDSGAARGYLGEKYTFDNMLVSVAGSFNEAELLESLEAAFSEALPGRGKKSPSDSGSACAKERVAAGGLASGPASGVIYTPGVRLRNKDIEQINFCIGFEGIGLGDDDIYPLHLVNTVFGGGMSSVLFQKIREELGLAYSIYSYMSIYKGGGLYTIYAGMQAENAGHVFNMVLDETAAFIKAGMTSELLDRAKQQFKSSFLMGLESPNARMISSGKSELLMGYVKTPDEIVQKIENVTLDDAYNVMTRVFSADKLAASAVGRIDADLEKILRRDWL